MRVIGLVVARPHACAACCGGTTSQQERVARIGVVWLRELPQPPLPSNSPLVLLRQNLHQLGYVEGQNIAIEARFVVRQPISPFRQPVR
jgi:hypothetical protein